MRNQRILFWPETFISALASKSEGINVPPTIALGGAEISARGVMKVANKRVWKEIGAHFGFLRLMLR